MEESEVSAPLSAPRRRDGGASCGAGQSRRRSDSPGFAMTTFVLSMINANCGQRPRRRGACSALALAYGGVAQLLAGMWEFRTATRSAQSRSAPTGRSGSPTGA